VTTFRDLVSSERPLVLPGAHDALSALLIRQAGFKAFFIGGFPVAGVRYGLPDIGLLGLREFADAYRDILAVTDLPALVDADNGYGDHKNVVYVVHSLERLGAPAPTASSSKRRCRWRRWRALAGRSTFRCSSTCWKADERRSCAPPNWNSWGFASSAWMPGPG
jgi:hypothetical protein